MNAIYKNPNISVSKPESHVEGENPNVLRFEAE